jgi:AAA domain
MIKLDLLNIEPQKISTDLATYTSMLYGTPKVGKTTFYFELFGDRAIFGRTEKGSKAVPGLMGQDIASWSDFLKFKNQLKRKEVRARFDAVVLDTYDNLCIYLERYIKNKYEVDKLNDANGGWGAGQNEFTEIMLMTLNEIESYGYTIHFVSHISIKTEKLPGTETEYDKYIPAAKKRGMEVATKMVDNILFGYLTIDPETKQERRALYTRESIYFQAGTRFKHLESPLEFSAKAYQDAVNEAISKVDPKDLKTDRETNVVETEALDFEDLMNRAKKIAVAAHHAGKMKEVTAIVEKNLGKDKLLKDATPTQIETVSIIVDELEMIDLEPQETEVTE